MSNSSSTPPIVQGVARSLFGTIDTVPGSTSVSSVRVPPTPASIGFSVTKTCTDSSGVAVMAT